MKSRYVTLEVDAFSEPTMIDGTDEGHVWDKLRGITEIVNSVTALDWMEGRCGLQTIGQIAAEMDANQFFCECETVMNLKGKTRQ